LVAPDFTAPVSVPPPRMAAALGDDVEYPRKKSGGWLLPIAVILLAGAVGGAWMSGKLQPLLVAVGLSKAPAPSAEPAPSASAAPEKPEEATSAAPAGSAAASASAAPSAAPSAKAALAGTPRTSTPREPAPIHSGSEAPAPKETAPKPAGGAAEFDPGAAKAALTSAASNASSCKEAGGPTGSGKVSITFAPSGRPTSVAVTGELAGTTVGSCVARTFRAARVPPFSGDAVSVSKSFSVQ
jgi:cytoskeletal protein RodZ